MSTITHKRSKNKQQVVDKFKDVLNDGFYIDISKGQETKVGLSREDFLTCIRALTSEGYVKETVYIEHVNDDNTKTKIDVLAPKRATATDIWNNIHQLATVRI